MPKEKRIEFIFLGVILAFGALLLENAFNIAFSIQAESVFKQLTIPLFAYFFIEEFLKLIVLNKKNSGISTGRIVFSNSFFLGLGFALTEIFHRYLLNANLPSNDLAPLVGFTLIHLATSVVIGYCLYKKFPLWIAIIPPLLLHTAYNFIIIYELGSSTLALYLFALIIFIFFIYWQLKNASSGNLPNN